MSNRYGDKTVDQLGLEIFNLTQGDGGYAHISDGVCDIKTHDQLFGVIRGALKHQRLVAKKTAAWLRKYDEL